MRPIQKFTVIFAALLILLNVSSAFPVSAESLKNSINQYDTGKRIITQEIC